MYYDRTVLLASRLLPIQPLRVPVKPRKLGRGNGIRWSMADSEVTNLMDTVVALELFTVVITLHTRLVSRVCLR